MTLTVTSEMAQEKAPPVLQHSIEREIAYLSIGLRKTQKTSGNLLPGVRSANFIGSTRHFSVG